VTPARIGKPKRWVFNHAETDLIGAHALKAADLLAHASHNPRAPMMRVASCPRSKKVCSLRMVDENLCT
jgi:hypothetical protein